MFALRILCAGLLLGGASLASAQTITLRGEVEDEAGGFILSCTPVQLVSGGANLNAVLGEEVEAIGTIVGPNLVSVSSVTLVSDILEVSNDVKIGGPLKLEISGPPGRVEQVYFSLGSSFATVKKMAWFLDTATQQFLFQGVIALDGQLEVTFTVPNMPVLVGLDINFQDVRPSPAGFVLGNTDCVTIQS